MKTSALLVASFCITAIAVGCSSSPTDSGPTPTAGTGVVAGTGSNAGGRGGSGGGVPASITCGTKTCMNLGAGLGMLGMGLPIPVACCADQTASVCGTMSGTTCMAPPAVDTRCPAVSVFGMMANPCCINNNCGIDGSPLVAGCQDLSSPMLRSFVQGAPPPQHCDGTPFPTMGTAGMPASGGATAAGSTGAGSGGSKAGSGGAGGANGAAGAHAGSGGAAGH